MKEWEKKGYYMDDEGHRSDAKAQEQNPAYPNKPIKQDWMIFIKLFGEEAVKKKFGDDKIDMKQRSEAYGEAFEKITSAQ